MCKVKISSKSRFNKKSYFRTGSTQSHNNIDSRVSFSFSLNSQLSGPQEKPPKTFKQQLPHKEVLKILAECTFIFKISYLPQRVLKWMYQRLFCRLYITITWSLEITDLWSRSNANSQRNLN